MATSDAPASDTPPVVVCNLPQPPDPATLYLEAGKGLSLTSNAAGDYTVTAGPGWATPQERAALEAEVARLTAALDAAEGALHDLREDTDPYRRGLRDGREEERLRWQEAVTKKAAELHEDGARYAADSVPRQTRLFAGHALRELAADLAAPPPAGPRSVPAALEQAA